MAMLQDIRQQYPQYQDMSDQQLADGLYNTHYSDMPKDQFYQKIGIAQSTTPTIDQELRATTQNSVNTNPASAIGAYALNALQAPTFGYGDEIASGILAAVPSKELGNTYGERYGNLQKFQQSVREAGQNQEGTRIETPSYLPDITATGIGQIGAGLATAKMLPFNMKAPQSFLGAVGKGSASGGLYGGVYGSGQGNSFANASDSAEDRIKNAGLGAIAGGIGGGLMSGATYGIGQARNLLNNTSDKLANNVPIQTPKNSDDLKALASSSYQNAADKGGTLKPDFTNKFLDSISDQTSKTRVGDLPSAKNSLTNLAEELKTFRNTPMNLNEVQDLDELLGEKIDNEFDMGGLSKVGKKLLTIQSSFRDMIEKASPNQIVGGTEGFNSLKDARDLWAKSYRVRDIERIMARAESMQNPATAMQTGFRTLANNPSRLRGYSKEQQEMIKNAAKSTLGIDALKTLGSRLISVISAGSGHPWLATANYGLSGASRSLAEQAQRNRGQELIQRIISGISPSSQPQIGATIGSLQGLQTLNGGQNDLRK